MLCFFNVFAIFLKVKRVDCRGPFLYDRKGRPSCLKNLNFRLFNDVGCFNQLTYYAEYEYRPESSIAVLHCTKLDNTVTVARQRNTDICESYAN